MGCSSEVEHPWVQAPVWWGRGKESEVWTGSIVVCNSPNLVRMKEGMGFSWVYKNHKGNSLSKLVHMSDFEKIILSLPSTMPCIKDKDNPIAFSGRNQTFKVRTVSFRI